MNISKGDVFSIFLRIYSSYRKFEFSLSFTTIVFHHFLFTNQYHLCINFLNIKTKNKTLLNVSGYNTEESEYSASPAHVCEAKLK